MAPGSRRTPPSVWGCSMRDLPEPFVVPYPTPIRRVIQALAGALSLVLWLAILRACAAFLQWWGVY